MLRGACADPDASIDVSSDGNVCFALLHPKDEDEDPNLVDDSTRSREVSRFWGGLNIGLPVILKLVG